MNKQSPISFILVTVVKFAVVATVVYYVYLFSVEVYTFGYRIFNEPPLSASTFSVSITVGENDSVYDIATDLEENRLIEDKNIFFLQEWFSKYEGDIQPGTYELTPSMTGDEMIHIMAGSQEE
ncbi:MAG: endolytic transglycosylase MltG [Eubacteriales bacterium]